MGHSYSFRFAEGKYNAALLALLKKHRVNHAVEKDGTIRYSQADEELVENELLRQVRDRIFSHWQVITCPADWTNRYKNYMVKHDVPFVEELIDNELCFLIPRKFRPHLWSLGKRRLPQKA